MTSSSRLFSLQVFLLALTLFSWGLLFLSVALPGQHAFRKDLRMNRFLERTTLDHHRTKKDIRRDSCAECWSVLRGTKHENKTGSSSGWSDADPFYFFSLNSALTSLRIRLRMAEKVAGNKRTEVNEIECKVKRLHQKVKKIFEAKRKVSPSNTTKTPSFRKNVSEASFESSKKNNKMTSLNLVPLPKVSVIVDGRDSDIEFLINSEIKVFAELIFHIGVDISSTLLQDYNSEKNIYFYEISKNASRGGVYNMLMRRVTSPYTLVASDLRYLHEDIKLDKLISYLQRGNVWAVGGGLLSPQNEWQNGCLQTTFKNFRATFYRKTIAWLDGCLVCSALDGPFLALTPVLRTLEWNEHLSKKALPLDLFLRSFHFHHQNAASCPDLVFASRETFETLTREDVVELAKVHRLKEVHLPQSPPVVLKCQEMKDVCRESGEMVSPCCLAELASMIQFFLSFCEAHRLFCELQEGSLLGAVKFGDVLPWERDADITFHTANFSAIRDLTPVFANAGFTLKLTDNRWCCVNGSEAGGEGKLFGDRWIVELYSQHAMDSEEMTAKHQLPTKVELHGGWVRAPTNPGEYARNRYGRNIYRHSQHWLDLGKVSGWEEYSTASFSPCRAAGHHSCLDLNPTDGVAQFRLPCA